MTECNFLFCPDSSNARAFQTQFSQTSTLIIPGEQVFQYSSLYRISRKGGPRSNGGRIFFSLEKSKNSGFCNLENCQRNLKKLMKNLQFSEKFKIYIQSSQWKTDFSPFSLPSSRTLVILQTPGTYQFFWLGLGEVRRAGGRTFDFGGLGGVDGCINH